MKGEWKRLSLLHCREAYGKLAAERAAGGQAGKGGQDRGSAGGTGKAAVGKGVIGLLRRKGKGRHIIESLAMAAFQLLFFFIKDKARTTGLTGKGRF